MEKCKCFVNVRKDIEMSSVHHCRTGSSPFGIVFGDGIGYLLYKRNGVQGTDSVLDVCIQCKLHICKTETYESLNTIFVLLFLFIHIFARDVCIRLEIVCLRVVRLGSHTFELKCETE